jgi:predicted transcriptional regulator
MYISLMKGFLDEMIALGVNKAELERISGLSYQTIAKINNGDPSVRADKVARMQRTVDAIKKQLGEPPILPRKAGFQG